MSLTTLAMMSLVVAQLASCQRIFPADSEGWVLAFRHKMDSANGPWWRKDAWEVNPNQPESKLFSVMNDIEKYKRDDGNYVFKLVNPGMCESQARVCKRGE